MARKRRRVTADLDAVEGEIAHHERVIDVYFTRMVRLMTAIRTRRKRVAYYKKRLAALMSMEESERVQFEQRQQAAFELRERRIRELARSNGRQPRQLQVDSTGTSNE